MWSPQEVIGRIRATEKPTAAIPERYSDELLGVAILHHDGRDPLGVGDGQAVADRGAVVLDVVGATTRYRSARAGIRLRNICEPVGKPWSRRIAGASVGTASR